MADYDSIDRSVYKGGPAAQPIIAWFISCLKETATGRYNAVQQRTGVTRDMSGTPSQKRDVQNT